MKLHLLLYGLLSFLFGLTSYAELHRREISPRFDPKGAKKIKVAFFDADSTLRIAPSDSVSASGPRDTWLLPLVTAEIARLHKAGYLVAIVSNQGGVPRSVSLEDADAALHHVRMVSEWLNPEAIIHYMDFAENKDHDRKPETGMMERLESILKKQYGAEVEIDKAESFMCGDSAYKKGQMSPDGRRGTDFSDSDRLVAQNYGIKFIDPAELFGWRKYGVERFQSKGEVDAFFNAHPELKMTGFGKCPFPSVVRRRPALEQPGLLPQISPSN